MSLVKPDLVAVKNNIAGGLIVSCQAPKNSPLAKPEIIAALAETALQNGAVGVRIDSPAHIEAVRHRTNAPIIGIYKIVTNESDVYITPTKQSARAIAEAGATIIALDVTMRQRPDNEQVSDIIRYIREELGLLTMADISTFEEGLQAAEMNCDFIGTTLSGYTPNSPSNDQTPDFELVRRLTEELKKPVICEGRIKTPHDLRHALDLGAHAVVVGGAITGVDKLVEEFAAAADRRKTFGEGN